MNPPPPTKPKTRQPAGAEKYDEGALNTMQQIKTNEKKVMFFFLKEENSFKHLNSTKGSSRISLLFKISQIDF